MNGEKQTELVDVKLIGNGVRIAMFVPEKDEICPFWPMQEIATEFTKKMPDATHGYYGSVKHEEFMKELIE